MKAMILAAGKGTRVAPFTLDTPKPMLKVMGEPVIDNILSFLRRNHIEDVLINTSYLGDKLQSYLGDGTKQRMSLTYSFEGIKSGQELISKPLGSAGGLREIQRKYRCFDDTFMVLCGDALIDFDLDYALAFHKARNSMATVILKEVPNEKLSAYGVVDLDETGKIRQFQEKPSVEDAISNKVSTGIYIFEPAIFEYLPDTGEFDIGGELLPLLANLGEPLYGCELPLQWIDIGNIYDLWQANLLGLYRQIKHFPEKGQEVKPGVFVGKNVVANWDKIDVQGPIYIGPGTIIEDNCTLIGPAIIAENCLVQSCSYLNNVVIDPYTCLKEGTITNRQWVSPEFTIDLLGPGKCVKLDSTLCVAKDLRDTGDFTNVTIMPKRSNA